MLKFIFYSRLFAGLGGSVARPIGDQELQVQPLLGQQHSFVEI